MNDYIPAFLAVIGLLLFFSIPAYLEFGEHDLTEPSEHLHVSELASRMSLSGSGAWEVTILRRSGYVHDAWEYHGTAIGALQTAQQKLRQASLEMHCVRANSAEKFEAIAAYESAGARRTGKYIGGFVITPLQSSDG